MTVAQNAYCNECGTRVPLTESGECVFGHSRSALRDVREGEFVAAGPASRAESGAASAGTGAIGLGTPNSATRQETASVVLGKLIVIVPATIVVLIALVTVYAFGRAMGSSKTESWLSSIGSLLLTGVTVAVVVWNRRRKMRR
jgi:hypothetical protein